MKAYYIGGASLGMLLFILLFAITGIGGCVDSNRMIKDAEARETNTVVIRYYMDTDPDTAPVDYLRIDTTEAVSSTLRLPEEKTGYTFLGYFDGEDPATAQQYTDAEGNLQVVPPESVMLYPVFQED